MSNEKVQSIYERSGALPWDKIAYCTTVQPLRNGTSIKKWIKYETYQIIEWTFVIVPDVDGVHTIEITCRLNERDNLEMQLTGPSDFVEKLESTKLISLKKASEYHLNITLRQPLYKDEDKKYGDIRILFYD